jgi:hypothetical protein
MWELLLANANTIWLTVVIPILLMGFFGAIRHMYGNSITAMPDILIFLVSVDFYFALNPEPWVSIVHPSFATFFSVLYFSFGLISMLIFLFTLRVERRLIYHWVKRTFPGVIYYGKPDRLKKGFPYFGIMTSWFLIAAAVAFNMFPFSQR